MQVVGGEMKSDQLFAAAGALFAAAAVAFGAFGAHVLKSRLPADLLGTFETGVRYQMYHAIGLLAAAWVYGRHPGPPLDLAGWLFIAGIGIFCGSLYVLALSGIRWVGAVTPLGGLSFIAGWIALFVGILRSGR